MKSISAIIAAVVLLGSISFASAESCCDKAKAAGKDCGHACCVKAKKDGKTCEKCNEQVQLNTASLNSGISSPKLLVMVKALNSAPRASWW